MASDHIGQQIQRAPHNAWVKRTVIREDGFLYVLQLMQQGGQKADWICIWFCVDIIIVVFFFFRTIKTHGVFFFGCNSDQEHFAGCKWKGKDFFMYPYNKNGIMGFNMWLYIMKASTDLNVAVVFWITCDRTKLLSQSKAANTKFTYWKFC